MGADARPGVVVDGGPLGFVETANLLDSFFGWSPGPATALLIKVLSRFVEPMEEGSYHGRPLPGNPHRVGLVTAGPLTVFALDGAGYRRRVLLAARLRYAGRMNVMNLPGAGRRGKRTRGGAGGGSGGGNGRRGEGRRKSGAGKSAGISPEAAERIRSGDELEVLLAIQEMSEHSVRVVPVVRASQQLPAEAPPSNVAEKARRVHPLALVRKATSLARTARTGSLRSGRPLVLKTWSEERAVARPVSAPPASELRSEMKKRLFSETRACAGPPSVSKAEVRRKVLADPFLRTYMQEYAIREGMSDDDVLHEATGFFGEIASDYRIGVARWVARFVDFIFDRFVDSLEIDKSGIRFITECDSSSRIVLVCSHKSYVDSLLMGYALLRSGLAPPQQAAGQNLTVWPVGWILRHCGAFYIRRTFAGETLYKEVFKAYVRYLLVSNYVSVLYIEGTRSRDGKLAKPRLGYLSILDDAMRKGVCTDITLLPVYLGYDKIPEEASHVKELTGGRKVSEGVGAFAKIYRSVNTSIGRAFVRFGEPVSMRSLTAGRDLEAAACTLCVEINKLTPVTGRSLAACGLLAPASGRVGREEALDAAGELLRLARAKGVEHVDGMGEVEAALDWFVREGLVEPAGDDGTVSFKVSGNSRRFLDYNKNIPLHHYAREALEALAARAARSRGDSTDAAEHNGSEPEVPGGYDVRFLSDLLADEFFLEGAGPAGDDDIRVGESAARVLASLAEPLLEGYHVALVALCGCEPATPVTLDDFVDACFVTGERMLASGGIIREESLSKAVFRNAARKFVKMGLAQDIRERDERGYEKLTLIPGGPEGEVERLAARTREFLAT